MRKQKMSTLAVAGVILIGLMVPQNLLAQVFTVRLPLKITMPNPCVPEDVLIQGEINATIQQNFDGATSHFDEHFVSKGKGVGLITSANYTYSQETENSLQIPGPPQTVAQEFVINHMLVSADQAPNFRFSVRLHTTLNAQGVPTANIVSFSTSCQ